ncbi:MAG: type II secretion system secretin GspD [Deltaproteobacteria bacterium]|nr:type II secretion system secretin GspD [Deltaproteobacteria bacterium]
MHKPLTAVVLFCFTSTSLSAFAAPKPPIPIMPQFKPLKPGAAPPPGSIIPGSTGGQPPSPSQPPPTTTPQLPGNTPPGNVAGNPAGNDVPKIDAKAAQAKGRWKFDFNKVQISEIVKLISEITQRNFIIPEKIKGNAVTIISPQDVTADEAYRAFLSALEVNDITIVKVGKFYKLVPSADAAKSPIPTYTNDKDEVPPNDNIVTKIIHLQHSDATTISNILNNFKSKVAQLAVYPPTNAIIVSEWGSNLVRMEQILKNLDTEGTNDQIHLKAIKYATASEMATKLGELFDVKKGPKTPGAMPVPQPSGVPGQNVDDTLSISKLIPDDRTNQLIIVANDFAYRQLEELIMKLDVPVGEDTGQVRVISLQNANAEDLAGTLSSLASGQPKKRATGPSPPGGTPAAPAGGGSASLFEGDVKITADKATNSLLVIASPADFRSVKRMVDQLDIPRRQVFIECAIMEVTISNDQSAGLQWYAPLPQISPPAGSDLTKSLPGVVNGPQYGGSGLLSQALSPLTMLNAFGGALAGISGPGIPVEIPPLVAGGATTKITVPSFAVILRALQTSSNANVISTPYLLATDNEEAKIEVGSKEPFAKGLGAGASLGGGGGGLGALGGLLGGATGGATNALAGLGGLGGALGIGQSQIERIDVSLDITLTPHINDSDRVLLEIDQKLEDIVDHRNIGGVDFPVTSKRSVKSKVVLEDQQTVVLGGLIKDNVTESVSGYPILSDIPIIGWLFKTKSTTRKKSNLLVVITPYIVRTRTDFQRIYERKYAEYKAYQELVYADSKDYRAYIDFNKKNGPFALMAKQVKKEMNEIQNGGKGDSGDVIVAPHGVDMDPASGPTGATGSSGTEGASGTTGSTVAPASPGVRPVDAGVEMPAGPLAPTGDRKEKLDVQPQ